MPNDNDSRATLVERLRAAHTDWNSDQMDDGAPPMDCLTAGDVRAAADEIERLAALLNDARTQIDAALHGLEIQQADVGKTDQCTHPNCTCWMGVCSKGAHGPTSERLMRKFYGPPK
jgi:hypothetical protein